jgi:hypothetical protein
MQSVILSKLTEKELKMARTLTTVFALLLFCATNALAGFGSSIYSSGYSRESGTAIAAVQIKDKKIYNLVVTVQFLRKPQDSKIYKSDEYEKLVDRLLIESRGIALQKILERKELALSDFSELKKGIETDISKLTTELKKKFLPNQDIEVVFSISDLYLLEASDK